MNARSDCAICPTPSLGQGTYPFLCLAHALAVVEAEGAKRQDDRGAYREAFRARNRNLTLLGPQKGAQGPVSATTGKADPVMLGAVASVMVGLGGTVLHVGPRYGPLPPVEAPLTEAHDPLQPCAVCGTTSSRVARAPYGCGDAVWVLCKAQDGCMSRLRAGKGSTEIEVAA